jgi:hypothetical protein
VVHSLLFLLFEDGRIVEYVKLGDGKDYIGQAQSILHGTISSPHVILYPIFIRILAFLFPYANSALLISSCAHILSAIPMYEILKAKSISYPKVYTFVLTTFPPTLVLYSSLALSDSLLFLFCVLFFYFLVRQKESGLISSGIFAAASHFLGLLLFFPIVYFYLKNRMKRVYRAFAVWGPIVLLSLYHQYAGQGLAFYWVNNEQYSQKHFGIGIFSIPFENLLKGLRGIPTPYPAPSAPELILVIGLFIFYALAGAISWRVGNKLEISFALPYLIFLAFYQNFFFIPRLIPLCFPLLFAPNHLLAKRPIAILSGVVAIVGIMYAGYYMSALIHVSATLGS